MMTRTLLRGLLITAFAHFGAAQAQDLDIEQVTIVSPERADPIRNANVTIRDGRIAAISTGSRAKSAPSRGFSAPRLDGGGLYLVPGLIDSHVHLGGAPGMTEEQE